MQYGTAGAKANSNRTTTYLLRLLHFWRSNVRRCGHPAMPRKRKKKIFSAAKVVREMARERVGSPKPSQLVRAKKSKPERHKPTLGKLLTDE
jgi:hypothetical protein